MTMENETLPAHPEATPSLKYHDLIARLEKAAGPDRELDRDIFKMTLLDAQFEAHHAKSWFCTKDSSSYGFNTIDGRTIWCGQIPEFTRVIEAVLLLLTNDFKWTVGIVDGDTDFYGCVRAPDEGNDPSKKWMATGKINAAIALCLPALKARSSAP